MRKGDIVRQGQVLARLNPTFSAADLTAMKDQVDLLSARAARLGSADRGKEYVPDPSNSHAGLQASIFDQQANEYKSSLEAYDKKIDRAAKPRLPATMRRPITIASVLGLAANIEGMRTEASGRSRSAASLTRCSPQTPG